MEEFFDREKEKKSLTAIKIPFLLAAFRQGIDLANRTGVKKVAPEDVFTANGRRAIEQRHLEMSAKAIGTTEEQLREILAAAHAAGIGVRGLAQQIDDLYGESMGYRSLRIARTELTGPLNDGAMQTYGERAISKKPGPP